METVADPIVLRSLKERLAAVTPRSQRRWGTLTAHEMLCHLGDAEEMALRIRPRRSKVKEVPRPILKWLALWTPIPFPRGVRTNPQHDPKVDGTRPADFERDRARVIGGLEKLASPDASTLETAHGMFGLMSMRDWQRWAWKHADHHLRQFGA